MYLFNTHEYKEYIGYMRVHKEYIRSWDVLAAFSRSQACASLLSIIPEKPTLPTKAPNLEKRT